MIPETTDRQWEPWQAAMVAELREIKTATIEVRDLLAKLPPPTTNGHAAQLSLGNGQATNGHTAKAPALDVNGNPVVRGVSFDPDGHPGYIASHTLDDGRRARVRVTLIDYGNSAHAYACAVLMLLKGKGDREKLLASLPEKLRMRVMLALLPKQ